MFNQLLMIFDKTSEKHLVKYVMFHKQVSGGARADN